MRRVRLTKRQMIQAVFELKNAYCSLVNNEDSFFYVIRLLRRAKTFAEVKRIIQNNLEDFNQDNCLLYACAPVSYLNFDSYLSPTFKQREEKRRLLLEYLDEDLDNDHYGPQHDDDFTAMMPIDYQV